MSQELMKQLQQVVKEKMDDCSITNLADVLMAYNLVSEDLMDCPKQLFKGKIEKTVLERKQVDIETICKIFIFAGFCFIFRF